MVLRLPNSGLVELEFGNVGFGGEGKTPGVPGEKPLGANERTNNKLNPHMASTQVKLVGGERSHHCATLDPHYVR